MDPLPRTGDRMHEADQHLDRLGTILRSLRAPPERPLASSFQLSRGHQSRHQEQHKHQHQHQQQQQEQKQHPGNGFDLHRLGGTSKSFTKPRHSQPADVNSRRSRSAKADRRTVNPFHRSNTTNFIINGRPRPAKSTEEDGLLIRSNGRIQTRSLSPMRRPPAVAPSLSTDALPRSNTVPAEAVTAAATTAAAAAAAAAAPKSTVAAAKSISDAVQRSGVSNSSGVGGVDVDVDVGDNVGGSLGAIGAKKPVTFRQRASRTWWRGLSCGVCFAAGAWTRDGHGLVGVLLGLAAVCGELALNEWK